MNDQQKSCCSQGWSKEAPTIYGGEELRPIYHNLYSILNPIFNIMMQTVLVKLETSEQEAEVLIHTMHQFNAACNDVAETAFKIRSANKIKLQKELYYPLKEKYGLSAQMTIRVIAKVCEAYKRDKSIQPTFKSDGAIVYDQRNLSWKGLDRISITTLNGRLKLPVKIGEYRKLDHTNARGQADLIFRNKKFYVAVVVDAPEEPIVVPENVLGVDLGIVNIATDSTGESFSGEQIDAVREKIATLRSDLQSKGTKSAKCHLKKIGRRESRFHRDINHCISKKIVAKAKDTKSLIAVEDLTGIRERITVRKSQRSRQYSWSFYQLHNFLEYKAALAGVGFVDINGAYTSQECPVCHTISDRNRPNRNVFNCIGCGFSGSADDVASLNIRNRVAVNLPIVSGFFKHNDIPQAQAARL
jgi:putative transposase